MNEEQNELLIKLLDEGMTLKEIAKQFNCSLSTIKKRKKKLGLEIPLLDKTCEECNSNYQNKIKHSRFCSDKCRNDNFMKNKIKFKSACVVCGSAISSYREKKTCSEECTRKHLSQANTVHGLYSSNGVEIRKKLSAVKRLASTLSKAISRIKVCSHCNKEYAFNNAGNTFKFCSDKCRTESQKERARINNRKHRVNKDKRWTKNGKMDYSISLKKLHKRDGGICHICNKQTNYKDFIKTEEGHFIAGNNYPSIDHVTPIAKGGLHSWDNVKLAHRICNSRKRDGEFEYQMFLEV